ncbi:TIGR03564 family F420-dependent LLM class oxidoreductase [Streptomyces sp. NPDC091267]|uniref:TIGR03564 family F420-dependent LLM class oxidoreductase n=1 Tax=Streptomyces sp. NPDC091267 TaxID=3155195 RepID=UPI00341E0A96
MRIGLYVGQAPSTEEALDEARVAAEAGLDSVFFSQVFEWDALTLTALAGQRAPGIELGTAVVQTYPRHPIALATQALTVQAVTGNRLTLGIGPSHAPIIENGFGLSYDRPARHIREYLSALAPLLRGEAVDHRGETLRATARLTVPGATAPPVLISALGPVMLRIAGESADGTVTVWATPRTIAEHVRPRIEEAAAAAGRGAPRVVAGVHACVTTDPEGVRRAIAAAVGPASELPSYRALLDRQGMSGLHETVLAGDEETVAARIRAFAEAGATDLLVGRVGDATEQSRTLGLLSALRRR